MPPQVPQENIPFEQPSQRVLRADTRKTNVLDRFSQYDPGELCKATAEQSERSAARPPEGTAGLHSAGPHYKPRSVGCPPSFLLFSEAQLRGRRRGREKTPQGAPARTARPARPAPPRAGAALPAPSCEERPASLCRQHLLPAHPLPQRRSWGLPRCLLVSSAPPAPSVLAQGCGGAVRRAGGDALGSRLRRERGGALPRGRHCPSERAGRAGPVR